MCKLSKFAALFLLFLFLISCGKEEQQQTVPFAPVYFRIDLIGLDHSLKNPLSYKVFTETDRRTPTDRMGFGGLLIVSSIDGNEIFAYDLACPFEGRQDITVTPTNAGEAVCSTCGSVFVTMFGFGTAKSDVTSKPLQRYRVQRQSSGIFLIRN
jgi:nitrite reductase/ring-hydroxylating ferredoxin subunit